jgi:hypothetical protein
MDTVRPRTILRKGTDTFHWRASRHWFRLRRKWSRTANLDRFSRVVSDHFHKRGATDRTGTARSDLEQVPRDGVDQGNEEANHQPLHRVYPAQAFGKRPRQAEGRPADGLNSPHNTKYAEDRQTHQSERVEPEGRRNIAVKQCVTHPCPAAQRAVPTRQKTERTGQPEPGGGVKRAEGEPAGKEGADVPGCARGPK